MYWLEARAAIVIEVQRREHIHGSASKGIATLLADAGAGILPATFVAWMALASDKKHSPLPSRSRIFAWRQAYLAGGVTALLPEVRVQETKADIPEWMTAFLRHYAGPAKRTMAHALDRFRESLSDQSLAPSYDQVRRAMKALEGTGRWLDAHKGREGPLALKARLIFTRRTTDGLDPTSVYTADGKTFDAYVAHPIHGRPFRPEITSMVDVVTRKCVGWSVGLDENTIGVADALRHACQSHGIPAIFYTDNGSGYRNDAMDGDTIGMCARLGITSTHSIAFNSQARGIIERFNGSVWNKLSKDFATYQGADMDREAHQKRWRAISKQIREVGSSPLLPSWQEFIEKVELAVADYNNRPHSSLRLRDPDSGRMRAASPSEVWLDFVAHGFEPVGLTEAEADDLFRPHVRRTVARGEVQWNSNQYSHEALQPYHGMEVLVGIDIHDATRVWVRRMDEIDGEKQPGALICVAGFWNNKASYFPKSYVASATENRAKGRLRRVDIKREEIQEEARGAMLIDALPMPMPEFIQPAAPEPIAPTVLRPVTQPTQVGKPYRHDDADLAMECINDPSLLTPNRARLLREAIRFSHGRDIMRIAGVDLDTLESLLRSAA